MKILGCTTQPFSIRSLWSNYKQCKQEIFGKLLDMPNRPILHLGSRQIKKTEKIFDFFDICHSSEWHEGNPGECWLAKFEIDQQITFLRLQNRLANNFNSTRISWEFSLHIGIPNKSCSLHTQLSPSERWVSEDMSPYPLSQALTLSFTSSNFHTPTKSQCIVASVVTEHRCYCYFTYKNQT